MRGRFWREKIRGFHGKSDIPDSKVGIGIQKTNAGIGIPASVISVRYRTKKMPD
jgi:hypothetical protein